MFMASITTSLNRNSIRETEGAEMTTIVRRHNADDIKSSLDSPTSSFCGGEDTCATTREEIDRERLTERAKAFKKRHSKTFRMLAGKNNS